MKRFENQVGTATSNPLAKHGETVLLRAPVRCSRKGRGYQPALPGPDLVVWIPRCCVVKAFAEQHNPQSLRVLAMVGTPPSRRFQVLHNRGGTFTDVYAEVPMVPPHRRQRSSFRTLKLLSEIPPTTKALQEGIRRILEEVTGGDPRVRGAHGRIEWIHRHDGRDERAAGARGARSALVVTEGGDLSPSERRGRTSSTSRSSDRAGCTSGWWRRPSA